MLLCVAVQSNIVWRLNINSVGTLTGRERARFQCKSTLKPENERVMLNYSKKQYGTTYTRLYMGLGVGLSFHFQPRGRAAHSAVHYILSPDRP